MKGTDFRCQVRALHHPIPDGLCGPPEGGHAGAARGFEDGAVAGLEVGVA